MGMVGDIKYMGTRDLKYLVCNRYLWSKCCPYSLCYRWENWGLTRLYNLHKVIELVNSKMKSETQVCPLLKFQSFITVFHIQCSSQMRMCFDFSCTFAFYVNSLYCCKCDGNVRSFLGRPLNVLKILMFPRGKSFNLSASTFRGKGCFVLCPAFVFNFNFFLFLRRHDQPWYG